MENRAQPGAIAKENASLTRDSQSEWFKILVAETATSSVANMFFRIAFVFIVFHGLASILVSGHGGLVQDAFPQCFMVGLMGALIPPAILRKRVIANRLPVTLSISVKSSFQLFYRSVLFALAATIVAFWQCRTYDGYSSQGPARSPSLWQCRTRGGIQDGYL